MNNEEKLYWLGFSAFPGIGPLRFKLLREYFGSAKKAWEAQEEVLFKIGLGEKLTAKFIAFKNHFSLEDYEAALKKENIWVITLGDKNYPKLLQEIPDAPFVLYIRGERNIDWDIDRSIAIVGTRKITNYGREVTRRLVEGLVDAGLTIVSGMAYGVDAVAHESAIEGRGKTIAVLGCGVDVIHPKSNTTLYWTIIKKAGWVISEFPMGRFAEKGLFPARNRIISGLSLGVVVTEGAEDSGALITASYAAEQGREVFAVPGPITSQMSKGPTILLKQGAKIVTEAKDILDELKIKKQESRIMGKNLKDNKTLSKEEKSILILLQNENLHFDDLVRKSSISASRLAGLLTMMEMQGLIKNLGQGVYSVGYG